jgi:hypothetical protein
MVAKMTLEQIEFFSKDNPLVNFPLPGSIHYLPRNNLAYATYDKNCYTRAHEGVLSERCKSASGIVSIPVTNRNRVIERWGGERQEVNERSAG